MDRGSEREDARVAIEAALTAKYGISDSAPVGHTFLLASGKFTANLGHHSPAARFALGQAGVAYSPYDELTTFIRLTCAIRTEASRGIFHVQVEGDMTLAQLRAIAAATSVFPSLIYDIHAPDGSAFHTGEGLLDFLDDPLVAEALRRGKG